jgi:hypothetical protein
MPRFFLAAALASTLLAGRAQVPRPDTSVIPPDTLLALRVGAADAGDELTIAAAPVFLDVLNVSTGAVLRTIALPTATIFLARQHAVTAYATSNAEGVVGASGDGTRLVVTGYSAPPGREYPASESWSAVGRVVATVSCTGAIDSSTRVSDAWLGGGNIRSAATYDGSYFYVSTEQEGLLFVRRGGTQTAPSLRMDNPPIANPRMVAVHYDALAGRWALYLTASAS